MKPAMQPKGPAEPQPDPRTLFALGDLIGEVRRLAGHLDDVARFLHSEDDLSVAERGLMLLLRRAGPQTIPQLASSKEVSRQYIRQALRKLVARGLLIWQDNPAHRRSRLAALTPDGDRLMGRVLAREGAFLRELAARFERDEVAEAAAVLCRMDGHLMGEPATPGEDPSS